MCWFSRNQVTHSLIFFPDSVCLTCTLRDITLWISSLKSVWMPQKYLCVKLPFNLWKTSIYPRKFVSGMHLSVFKVWFKMKCILSIVLLWSDSVILRFIGSCRIYCIKFIPIDICSFFFAGFSLAAWQIAEGVANTFPIDSSVVDNLLSDLNVAALISYPACSPTDSEYANAMTNLQKMYEFKYWVTESMYIQFVHC